MDVENFQKRLNTLPTKPTKPGYVSFVSTPHGHIQKNSSWLERLKAVKEEAPPVPMKEITRTDLEAMHPPTIRGIPLSVILDQADPSDYPDLADRDLLEAFAVSLIAPGNPLWKYQPEPEQVPRLTSPLELVDLSADPDDDRIRCRDCALLNWQNRCTGGPGGRPHPDIVRRCDEYQVREGAE